MATILIVDNSLSNRQFLTVLLRSCGHHLTEARDGIEALETIRAKHFDLVISDVLMLTMDGFEFVKQLRADPITATLPVIFYVAACYEQEAKLAALECGVKHVITKPAEPDVIIAAVNAALLNQTLKMSSVQLALFARHNLISPSDPINPNGTVYVVDDDPAMGRLMCAVMSGAHLKSVAYSSAEDFLADYRDEPGCILLDLHMPSMSGIALLQSLRARRMQIPAIILTARGDLPSARFAMRLRVLDFLEKTADHRTLLVRVYYALQEDSIQRKKDAQVDGNRRRMADLTEREQELMKLLFEGKSSKQIAVELRISIRTVGNHRAHMLAKTGAANVADLVRMTMLSQDA